MSRVNDTPGAGWCLDVLAWSADDEGRPERAATLLGAVTGLAHAMGARAGLFPEMSAHHEQYEQRTRIALGEQAYQAAFARGESMSLDEAVAYALDEPRPPAAPPPSGRSPRSSSSPPRTAESHVEHILAKLGVTNRAQMAAWTAQQRSDGCPDH